MKYAASLLVVLLAVFGLFLLNTIYPVFSPVANLTDRAIDTIAANWRSFFLGDKNSTKVLGSAADIDDLNARIQAEIDKALADRFGGSGGADQGLIVAPQTKGSATPADIAKYFSDEVKVYPDDSGQSGIIVPVFRDGKGEPYIYIITPVKQ